MGSLKMATKKFNNKKYPIGYQVQDSEGNALVAHSGLFGWGWCHSREAAIFHARVEASDVQAERKDGE